MSFNILSSASKRSENAIRSSRTSVKTRIKVDELKVLESIRYKPLLIFLFLIFFLYFFKNLYVYEYSVRGLPPCF